MPSAPSKLHILPPLNSLVLVIHALSMPKKASAHKNLPLILAVPAQKSQMPLLKETGQLTKESWLTLAKKSCLLTGCNEPCISSYSRFPNIPQVYLPSSVTSGFCTLSSFYIFGLEMTKKTRHVSTKFLPIQKKEYLGNWRMRQMKDGIKEYR